MFKGRSPVGTIHCRFANSPAFIGSLVNENCCIVGGTEGGGSMYGRVMTGVSCTSRVPTCFDVDGSAAFSTLFLFFFFAGRMRDEKKTREADPLTRRCTRTSIQGHGTLCSIRFENARMHQTFLTVGARSHRHTNIPTRSIFSTDARI